MSFQIALVQFEPIRKDVARNIQIIRRLLKGIKANLVVLPELSNSGYLYRKPEELLPYAEKGDCSDPFLYVLQEISMAVGGIIVAGYAELADGKLFNAAAAVSEHGIIQNYRKIHLYADEKSLFQPGNTGFSVFDWHDVKIGMMICFDWIFPESARTLSLQGAQIIAHPANLVMPYCQDAMVTRSIENRVFTITANRIGDENLDGKKLLFTGRSQITAPHGHILYRGPENVPTVHIMDIDPQKASQKNISPQNNLISDRRPEFYDLLG